MELGEYERVVRDTMHLLGDGRCYKVTLNRTVSQHPCITCEATTDDGQSVVVRLEHGSWHIVESSAHTVVRSA